ncbi:MAG: apolipoprotein N-acyltransferase [Fimbriimonadales bacterium]
MGVGVTGALVAPRIVCGIYQAVVAIDVMKKSKLHFYYIAIIVLSALTTSLAFPPVNWYLFLFFAPALGWRYAIGHDTRASTLRMAIWGGTFAGTLGWHALPTLTQQSLSFGLCVFVIIVIWAVLWHATWGGIVSMLFHKKALLIPIAACLWTSIAWLRSLGALGFPWGMLSLALTNCPILLQPSDIGGIWIVEWLIVAWNIGLTIVLRYKMIYGFLFLLAEIVFWLPYSLVQNLQYNNGKNQNDIYVSVIQINTNRSYINEDEIHEELRTLIESATKLYAQTLVFPESVETPNVVTNSEMGKRQLKRWSEWASNYEVDMLVGIHTVDVNDFKTQVWNRAYLFDKKGGAIYHSKTKLVPIVENQYQFIQKWVGKIGLVERNLCASDKPRTLISSSGYSVAPLLCMESLFGWVARHQARDGAQWLAVMANDYWLIGRAVREQYADFCVVRAIETRRWVARASTVGVSGFYAPTGERVASLPVGKPGVLVHQIAPRTDQTLYVRWGDWWVYGCLGVVALGLGLGRPWV